MKLPNADKAVIAAEKLRDYLLNIAHKRGGSKARLLISLGFTVEDWSRLEADLRAQHLASEVVGESSNGYGNCYEIVAPLVGPNGKSVVFRSIWQIDTGAEVPRLITMYPE